MVPEHEPIAWWRFEQEYLCPAAKRRKRSTDLTMYVNIVKCRYHRLELCAEHVIASSQPDIFFPWFGFVCVSCYLNNIWTQPCVKAWLSSNEKEMNHVPHFKAMVSAWCVSCPVSVDCVFRPQQMCLLLCVCASHSPILVRAELRVLQFGNIKANLWDMDLVWGEYLNQNYLGFESKEWMTSMRALNMYKNTNFVV